VRFTALDAVDLGYKTALVADACRGVNLAPGDVDQAIEQLRAKGVRLVRSTDLPESIP